MAFKIWYYFWKFGGYPNGLNKKYSQSNNDAFFKISHWISERYKFSLKYNSISHLNNKSKAELEIWKRLTLKWKFEKTFITIRNFRADSSSHKTKKRRIQNCSSKIECRVWEPESTRTCKNTCADLWKHYIEILTSQ
jgi:hypothetical protein